MSRKKTGHASYPFLFKHKWSSITVDESHNYMETLTVVGGSMAGRGLMKLRRKTPLPIAVSGTPFGKPKGFFGTLHWLRPDIYSSFWRWAEQHLETEEGEYGMVVGGFKAENEEAFWKSLDGLVVRRTKREIMPELPPKQYVEVLCELEGEQARLYKEMKEEAIARIGEQELTAAGRLAELTRLKQFSIACGTLDEDRRFHPAEPSNKVDALMEKLDAHGVLNPRGLGEQALVFSQFVEVLELAARRLREAGVRIAMIAGPHNRKDADRVAVERKFQNGQIRVVLMVIKSAVSINLSAADSCHFLDEWWDPRDHEQAEDRPHRLDELHGEHRKNKPITVYYYRSEDTIDQYIQMVVDEKGQQQYRALDARRGLEYAGRLVSGSVS